MGQALYLDFSPAVEGSFGKVGGQPTKLPIQKPWRREEDAFYGFLLELRADELFFSVPGAEYVQLYQSIEEGDDPLPMAVVIPYGAQDNKEGTVQVRPGLGAWGITGCVVDEPDVLPPVTLTLEHGSFFKSKLGGHDPWENEQGRQFLGQISERPVDFNFAGMTCSLYLEKDGRVSVELQ
ncbi:MAG: hypothetical protein ACO1TE_06215 [Prosthecobacter sp.]